MLALCLGKDDVHRAAGRYISMVHVPSGAVSCFRILYISLFFNGNWDLFYSLVAACNIVASHIT